MSEGDELAVPRTWQAMRVSESALLIELGDVCAPLTQDAVHALFFALSAAAPPWLLDLHPAYTSLLVEFDAHVVDHVEVERFVRVLPSCVPRPAARRTHVVPVRYGGEAPCDLDAVAQALSVSRDDVIALHAGSSYTVAFLGFMPGFAYLAGLDPRLSVPRRAAPRARVPQGSVAVAAGQSAVYPDAGPGGWQLLGRTDADVRALSFQVGDVVRFEPIA